MTSASLSQIFSRSYSFSSSPSASRCAGLESSTFCHSSIETEGFFSFSDASLATSMNLTLRSSALAMRSISFW